MRQPSCTHFLNLLKGPMFPSFVDGFKSLLGYLHLSFLLMARYMQVGHERIPERGGLSLEPPVNR